MKENQKFQVMLAELQERYQASHKIRERSVQFTLWISGMAIGLGWLLISQTNLILTVLATHHIQADDRDDIALSRTVTAISNNVDLVFVVYNPVDGSEELTARLSEEQKLRFQDAIRKFSDDAAKAIDNDDPEKASKLWRKQFGDRFPLVKKDENKSLKREDAAKIAGIYAANNPPKPWGWD